MKGCGKVFTLLIGILLGVVLTFGGIGYTGYYLVTRDGSVGMVEDLLGDNLPIEFSEEVRAKSFYNYGMDIYNAVMGAESGTLGDLEAAIGTSALIDMLATKTGIDAGVIRGSRISNLTEDLLDSITLGSLFTTLNMEAPDLPLFEREDVMNMPVLTAFDSFTDFTLGDFIRIETEGEEQSNPILIRLKDVSISDISNDMDSIMNDLRIDEITEIVTDADIAQDEIDYLAEHGNLDGYTPREPSSHLLQTFKNKEITLGDLMTDMDGILQDITMKEMTVIVTQEDIDADEAAYLAEHGDLVGYEPRELSSPLMINLKDVTLGDLMSDMDSIINDLALEDVIEIDEESNAALIALRDTKIGELGGAGVDEKIKEIKISELIDIDDESTQVMKYFRDNDTTLGGIDEAIKHMQMKDIMEIDEESSVLMQSLKYAALETYMHDNGTPDDPTDDYEVLGIEDTIAITPLSGIMEITTDQDVQDHEDAYLLEHGNLIGFEPLIPSSRIMQSLANSTLDNLDDNIKVLTLSEMITIVTDEDVIADPSLTASSKFLQALKDCPLETYTDEYDVEHLGVDDKIQITPISELMDIGSSHVWGYLGDKTLTNLGVAVDDMTLGDAVEIIEDDPINPGDPEKSHAILIALKDSKVSEIGIDLPNVIDDTLLSDIVEIDGSSPAILVALANNNTKIGDLNSAIAALTVEEIFPDATGALTLVPPTTTIDGLPLALTVAFTTSTLLELQDAGLLTGVPPMIEGWTIQDLVDNAI